MNSYSVVLFVHVASALVVAAALGMEWLLLFRLRRASGASDAESWLGAWKAVPWTASLSLLVLLLTGGYLVGRLGQWALAWPKAALVALVLIGALGGVTSKRMRLARKAYGADHSECLRPLRAPILKFSLNMRIGLLFAAVLLMTATPRLYASWGIVAAGLVLGFLVSLGGSARRSLSQAVEAGRESRASE